MHSKAITHSSTNNAAFKASKIRTQHSSIRPNHHAFQYLRTKSASRAVISTNQRSYKLQTIPQHQTTKLPWNSQLYLHRSQLKPLHTPSRQRKHLFCQCHLHQPDKQLLQYHHCTTIANNTFQDHSEQHTTINKHHYYQIHHTSTPYMETSYQCLQDLT